MNFLQFAVWGSYLTCIGNFLGRVGLGNEISWFYVVQGIVSIFMPAIIGAIADKFVQPQRMLGISHLVAGSLMLAAGLYAQSVELKSGANTILVEANSGDATETIKLDITLLKNDFAESLRSIWQTLINY